MSDNNTHSTGMSDDQYRGILTEREKEILSGDADVSESYEYRVVSRIRNKIERVENDVEVLEEHHPELLNELRVQVCGIEWARSVRKLLNKIETSYERHYTRLEKQNKEPNEEGLKEDFGEYAETLYGDIIPEAKAIGVSGELVDKLEQLSEWCEKTSNSPLDRDEGYLPSKTARDTLERIDRIRDLLDQQSF